LLPGVDGIHADSVTQQGATALAAAGVNGDDCYAQAVALIEAQTANQFIGQGRFARTARASNTDNRYLFSSGLRSNGLD
jgi:hypothetical protein